MTTEQLKKIKWLNRAFYAENQAKAWLEKLERDRSHAEQVSKINSGIGSGSGSSGNCTEDALIRLAETERRTQEKLVKLVKIRDEIVRAIEQVEDSDMQSILVWKYLNYYTFEQVAEKMHYSLITIRRKHKQALDEIELV
ncbi:MAG: DUF1492 domain-containing protein [Oscillospiraceae bacterium]|nr:DUF1492 domain-containing protein [Oscillospiraceae bacterium]